MKYFSFEELSRSATAKRLGIDNRPSDDIKSQLKALVENILDPLREAWGEPIITDSGYRCPKLNKEVGGAKNSQHCFDEKTEILTDGGWKTYLNICEDDNVYSYNMSTGKIELTPVDSIIIREHKGKMMHIKNTCLDIMVTDKHRMLVRYASHKYKRKGAKNISESGQAYFDSLKTDNDKYHIELAEDVFGKRRIYKCSGIYDGFGTCDLALLRFCMAFVSDGYWSKKNSSLAMGFRFKKPRKIEYLQGLAHDLGWPFTCHTDKHGVTNFYFRKRYALMVYDVVGEKKYLPKYLISLPLEERKVLIKTYAAFDGNFDERDENGRFSISSSLKHNADVLQTMIALSGIKCQLHTVGEGIYNIKGKSGFSKDSYILMTCNKDEIKASEANYEWVDYDGIVWCVNNKNTTLITRRNGKVSIQGNCYGRAADIRTVSDKPEENKRLLRLLLSLNLPFDKCISEYVNSKGEPSWIHVSYSPMKRKIKLTCRNGKYYSGINV